MSRATHRGALERASPCGGYPPTSGRRGGIVCPTSARRDALVLESGTRSSGVESRYVRVPLLRRYEGRVSPPWMPAESAPSLQTSREIQVGASRRTESRPSMKPSSHTPQATSSEFKTQKWDSVQESGCYVCNDTGQLLRVPTGAIGNKQSPQIEILGSNGPVAVTRLSADVRLGIPELRTLAKSASVSAKF